MGAGDGRYFVIVSKGTISESPSAIEDFDENLDSMRFNSETSTGDQSVESFLAYHEAKSNGYSGSVEEFEDEFHKEEESYIIKKAEHSVEEKIQKSDHRLILRSDGELFIPATLKYARGEFNFTVLERKGYEISSVEHILAALEACGVDNCRIELEGGREVPVIDGSAHGWTTLIIRVGVVQCEQKIQKGLIKVREPIIVSGKDDCFVGVFPSENTLITAGWDAVSRGAPCLGRSWYTWSVNHDFHFHYSVAPAKTFYHSEFELDALYDSGLVQAGPTICALVGMGEVFQDPGEVTFPDDEAARHKVIDLTGDLALLSQEGHGGIPVGHFVTWNANHNLQLKFCDQLWSKLIKSSEQNISSATPKISLKPEISPDVEDSADLEHVDDKFIAQMRADEKNEEDALRRVQMMMSSEYRSRNTEISD